MFAVHESYWVPMAILNFSGPAAIWLQSVQKKITGMGWESFTALLCTRFGHDKHQMLIRQFFAIKQNSSVANFIKRSKTLMHHLITYSKLTHPYLFLTQFVEGLRPDIRAVVLLQRPPDLDTACSLALLQEEVAEGEALLQNPKSKNPASSALLRSLPPSTSTAQPFFSRPAVPTVTAEDRRGTDASRANAEQSKISTMRAFRRASGLCFKCGERWGKDHTCPTMVQLHIVEELLDMITAEEGTDQLHPDNSEPDEDNLCTLSRQAIDGSPDHGVMQLQAWIQGSEVLLLVDSGSSSSFVDTRLAARLQGQTTLPKPCKVKVADGSVLSCSQYIPDCQWVTQGHEFCTDFKVISLGAYDAILGMDWHNG